MPDYKEIYAKYHSSKEAKHDRAMRNKVRREALREGKVHKGDSLEVDHIKPLSKGGSYDDSNTRIITRHQNRVKKDSYSRR